MRDTDRINELLDELAVYWAQNPDLRLGQIVGNIAQERGMDPYYIEDTQLIRELRRMNDAE